MKLSWAFLVGNFFLLIIFSMLFYLLQDSKFYIYEWFWGSSFPGNQINIWPVIIIVFSWIGAAIGILILFLNFRENVDLNKISIYIIIAINIIILISAILIITSAIMWKSDKRLSLVVFSFLSIFSISTIGTTFWVVKNELLKGKTKIKNDIEESK
ncbi:hypothetical protein [Spiroplasma taiwanense]|uniref:Transmembrane protein n=1 Tax=Spiroplasma taiwanense CT-1 TaxID=1276220 RepID=S5MHA1_9MOLU|nr:hypothetical protein [Spiroplasma taiwanense]AGR41215.1 hypothetical protein STAIW_v1c05930 [Spiroplasma taiwanense CT-1]